MAKKLCPFTFNAVISTATVPTAEEFECKKQKCALWDKELKQCCYLSQVEITKELTAAVAAVTGMLRKELKVIKARMPVGRKAK